jgi:hypothetical protein
MTGLPASQGTTSSRPPFIQRLRPARAAPARNCALLMASAGTARITQLRQIM